jgi:hypothetical protein
MSLYQKECIFLHSEIKMIECLVRKECTFLHSEIKMIECLYQKRMYIFTFGNKNDWISLSEKNLNIIWSRNKTCIKCVPLVLCTNLLWELYCYPIIKCYTFVDVLYFRNITICLCQVFLLISIFYFLPFTG